jgi:DNA-binding response OmpR family regulator
VDAGYILIVEEHPQVRALGIRVLEDAGYRVLAASDSPSARDIWSENSGTIKLLIVNLDSPETIESADLIGIIRKSESPIPVVYCCGFSDHAQELFGLAPVCILPKPYRPLELLAKVRSVYPLDCNCNPADAKSP